jgi:hypothetical protein
MPGTILGSPFHFNSADTEYDPNDITQAQQTGYSSLRIGNLTLDLRMVYF